MQLIGMLDSPFVRRVAIALRLLDLPYEHRPLSVFRNFEAFSLFNPMVKAPTLVLDDGTVLMDSSLILDYLECLAGRERSLLPQRPQARARALSLIGAALVACEKSVQIYYELNLRPEERRHGPWLERVEGQLLAAYDWLEAALRQEPLARDGGIDLVGVTVAVAWRFSQLVVAERSPPANTRNWQAIRIMRRGCRCSSRRRRSEPARGQAGAPRTARFRLRQAPVRRLAAPTWALRVGTGHMPGRAAIGARSAPWRQRANACAGSTDGSTAIPIFPRMPLSRLSRRAWARGCRQANRRRRHAGATGRARPGRSTRRACRGSAG